MPDLMERMYCSEQIHIPPTFPYIMKLYCKAAIRTQPYDLLKWSAAYFRALANGEAPPAKERIEYPPYDTPTGLTPGYIKVLLKQMGKDPNTNVSAQMIFIKWNNVCLQEEVLIKLLALMGARTNFNWLRFIAVAAGSISNTLTQTMILLCELLTDEPEGGMATLPLNVFNDLYTYLAYMNCGPLTEGEIQEIEAVEAEEDAALIAEKIRSGDYGEIGGESMVGEFFGEEESSEKKSSDESSVRPEESVGSIGEAEANKEIMGEGVESMAKQEEEPDTKEDQEKSERKEPEASQKEGTSEKTSKESTLQTEEDTERDVDVKSEETGEERAFDKKTEEDIEREEKAEHKITLDDLDEPVRLKVEEKLAGEEGSSEHSAEFDTLGSYLLKAEARAKSFTADEIGYRIFKKYLRQDVPGIGPCIEKEQVDKLTEFMDFWSQKQENMVMPRNIRHWMCPPLDKVPLPEP